MRISRDSLVTAFVLMLAILMVGSGLLGSRMWTTSKTGSRAAESKEVILVAATRINPSLPIKEPEKLFSFEARPASLVPKKAITSLANLEGRWLKTRLEAGQPLTEDDLLSPEDLGGSSLASPARTVALKVTSESLAGGFVQPSSRVDVFCTVRGKDPRSKLLLVNMLVLAVDREKDKPDQPAAAQLHTVTLAATPEEAAQLTLGSAVGELRLAARALGDARAITGPEVIVGDLESGRRTSRLTTDSSETSRTVEQEKARDEVEVQKALMDAKQTALAIEKKAVAESLRRFERISKALALGLDVSDEDEQAAILSLELARARVAVREADLRELTLRLAQAERRLAAQALPMPSPAAKPAADTEQRLRELERQLEALHKEMAELRKAPRPDKAK
jgi:pilus assembly protein CpaB